MFLKIGLCILRSFVYHLRNWYKPARLWAYSLNKASHRPGELLADTQRSSTRANVQWRISFTQGKVWPLPLATSPQIVMSESNVSVCQEFWPPDSVIVWDLWWGLWAMWFQLNLLRTGNKVSFTGSVWWSPWELWTPRLGYTFLVVITSDVLSHLDGREVMLSTSSQEEDKVSSMFGPFPDFLSSVPWLF